jgi:hypothetical protein
MKRSTFVMPLHPPETDRWLQVFDANESSEIASGLWAAFVVELSEA